jgi:diadenosine tetraphosphate (Ap4A) HIT family hydrolase
MDKSYSFCSLPTDRIIFESDHTVTIRNGFPVSDGHTLISPKRHVQSFFDLQSMEKADILWALDEAKLALDRKFAPAGYNIGINDGEAAFQLPCSIRGKTGYRITAGNQLVAAPESHMETAQ